jgi:hypothetical protein
MSNEKLRPITFLAMTDGKREVCCEQLVWLSAVCCLLFVKEFPAFASMKSRRASRRLLGGEAVCVF